MPRLSGQDRSDRSELEPSCRVGESPNSRRNRCSAEVFSLGQFQKKRIGLGAAGGDLSPRLFAPPCGPGGGGEAVPAPVTKLPIVGIGPRASRPLRVHVGGPGVDDSEIAEDADHDIMLANVLDGGTTANLGKEGLSIDQ